MVIGTLSEAGRYYGLHPRFREAFEYAVAHMDTLEPGKYSIDGDDLFISISEGALKTAEAAALEAHDRYIDIQVPVSRGEMFGWRPRGKCTKPRGGFDETKDIVFFDDVPTCYVSLEAGEFIVFFPEDAHAPMIGEGNIRKAILKVRVR